MPYIGQRPATGEANSFKILDDISNYTLTFGSSDIDVSADTITAREHRFVTGQRVTYGNGGGTDPTGLSNGTVYYIIVEDRHTFKLATNAGNAVAGTAINITAAGAGAAHTINVAFDGVNTKFKATHTNGTKADISQSGQLMVSVNGVLQQPHDNTTTPSTGYATDHTSTIIFSAAPAAGDQFFGRLIASNFATFDISDNTVDNFTGDGSTSTFTLSKTPPNNESILVTIDGVVQYPDDNAAVRAYTVSENILDFASAPGSAVEIQVRHIGFAGASTAAVSGFYGRTGNAALKNTDDIVFRNANVGVVTATDIRVTGNLTVDGTTTTLDTELVGVDKLEVSANNTTSAGIITQTGSGDILNLYDGSTEVFTVTDGGNIGIGITNPTVPLFVQADSPSAIFKLASTTATSGYHFAFGWADNSLYHRIRTAGGSNDGFIIENINSKVSQYFASSGDWNLNTNSSTRLSVTSTGDVGIARSIFHIGNTSSKIGFPSNKVKLEVTGSYIELEGTKTTFSRAIRVNDYIAHSGKDSLGVKFFNAGHGNDGTHIGLAAEDNGVNVNHRTFRVYRQGGMYERMRIHSDGNIGINSTAPMDKLSVSADNYRGVTVESSTTAHRPTVTFRNIVDSKIAYIQGVGNEIAFGRANADYGGHTEAVRISGSNVGIGLTNPDWHLDIKSTSVNAVVRLKSSGSTNGGQLQVNSDDLILRNRDAGNLQLWTNDTERLRISSTGQVHLNGATGKSTSGTSATDLLMANNAAIRFRKGDDSAWINSVGLDSNNNLKLGWGGSTSEIHFGISGIGDHMKLDSDGRLIIGSATASNAWTGGDDLILGNTNSGTRTGITLVSHSGSDGGIYWSDGTAANAYRGQLAYNHANDTMSLYTAAAARLRITSGGIVLINDANVSTNRADAPLQIETGASGNALNLRARSGDNIYSYLNFQNNAGSQTAAHIYLQRDASNNAGTLVFGTAAASANTPTERFVLKPDGKAYFNGNLGLGGQTSPTSSIHINNFSNDGYDLRLTGNALQFNRTSSSYIDQINDSGRILFRMGSSYTEAMRIESDGKIGINDTSPAALFTVNNGTNDSQCVQIKNDNVGLFLGTYGTGHGSYPREVTINGSRTDSGSSPYLRIAGQGGIKFCVDLNSERMRILPDGRVSVNNDNPTSWAKFAVKDSGADISGTADTSSNTRGLQLWQDQNDNKSIGLWFTTGGHLSGISGQRSNYSNHWGTDLRFYTHSPDTSNVTQAYERMRIHDTGNIGINRTSPTERIHMSGAIRQDGSGNNVQYHQACYSFASGTTHTLFTLSGNGVDATAMAVFEYVCLYSYAGTNHEAGIIYASTRRTGSNTAWHDIDNVAADQAGNDSNIRPNLFWDNGVLKITVPGSTQCTGALRLTTRRFTVTRNYSAGG